jgi:light-regulated signal transduction histidine kinase (bacteriophytochrome)
VIGAVATVEDLEQRVTKERMDEFSAFVGHDLKSPLRKIASFTKLLSDKITDRPAEDERHLLDRIFQSTTQAERLTDVLMRFARDGGSDESMSDVDMNAVADSVRISLEDQIHDAGALFRVDSLPVVRGRAFALERLLQNLVSNALKYGGDRPFVHLSASRDGQMWCFRVKDNGVGIPSEMLAGIFDLYDRGDTGSEDGHGVGLAICRQIVESHGGRIWANSSPARGSTFYFTVPG